MVRWKPRIAAFANKSSYASGIGSEPANREGDSEPRNMASAESTYEARLALADSFIEYKDCFTSSNHYDFLVDEALEGADGKLKYILALARRCKAGQLSKELLANKVCTEYSLSTLPQEQKGGVEQESAEVYEGTGTEIDEAGDDQNKEAEKEKGEAKESLVVEASDMDTEDEEAGDQQDDEENDDEDESDGEEEEDDQEEEAPQVSRKVETLIETFDLGFFARHRWRHAKPFVAPGAGYWMDAHRIKKIRTSTYKDFASATPKPMPVYIRGNPLSGKMPKRRFVEQMKGYHLCRKVAVSADGEIYRATDAEIEAALKKGKSAPSTDAATYVKAVQEVRRRHAITKARESGSG